MDLHHFERQRLEHFEAGGFAGESTWIADRQGRQTYLIGGGEGDGLALFVHGGLSDAGEWCRVAAAIGGRVLFVDRPGCGLTYKLDYRGLDYRQAAVDWLDVVVAGIGARSGDDPIDIVGSSMGGYFAIAFAAAYPERVRRLVFVGAPAGIDRPVPAFLRMWGHPLLGSMMARLGVTNIETPEELRKKVFPMLVAHPEEIPVEVLELAIAAAKIPGADLAASSMLRSVLNLGGWRRELVVRDDLARVALPTRFVWGEKDRFAPPSSGHDMVARMPSADIEVISDAGHVPQLDRPAAVATAINEFLVPGSLQRFRS